MLLIFQLSIHIPKLYFGDVTYIEFSLTSQHLSICNETLFRSGCERLLWQEFIIEVKI